MNPSEVNFFPTGGVQRIYSFTNGYFVSAIMCPHSHGGSSGLWEAAIMVDGPDGYEMAYTSNLTNDSNVPEDVVGYLSDAELADFLNGVRNLVDWRQLLPEWQ